MKCNNCGADVEPGQKFCINCGSKIEQPAESVSETTDKFCVNCGAELVPGAKFCVNCGAHVGLKGHAGDNAATVASETESNEQPVTPVNTPVEPPVTPPVIPYVELSVAQPVEPPVNPYMPQANNTVASSDNPYGGNQTDAQPSAFIPPVVPPPFVGNTVEDTAADSVVATSDTVITGDEDHPGKRAAWTTILILLLIAIAVGVTILLVNKKKAEQPATYYEEPYYEETESIAVEMPEDVAISEYFSENYPHIDVYGDMNGERVNLDFRATTYYDGDVSLSGTAYKEYGNRSLSGSGHTDSTGCDATVYEYDDYGNMTGRWEGRIIIYGSRLNFYGTYYNEYGNSYSFDYYE